MTFFHNFFLPLFFKGGQLGRLPARGQDGIIEFQSLQDEYWIPPNKRHALLLESEISHPDVLASVKELDDIRSLRKESNSDRDALAFALALHHNMTEAEVMARLNPHARPAPVAAPEGPPPGMEEEEEGISIPKISIQTNAMIALKLKSKARQAIRAVALKSRKRRSSVAMTQIRGLRPEERKKWGSHDDLSTMGEDNEPEQDTEQNDAKSSAGRPAAAAAATGVR